MMQLILSRFMNRTIKYCTSQFRISYVHIDTDVSVVNDITKILTDKNSTLINTFKIKLNNSL